MAQLLQSLADQGGFFTGLHEDDGFEVGVG